MANVIKKALVPGSILNEVDWDTGGYLIRYRIVAESKNLRSHWSPIYFIPLGSLEDVEGSYSEVLGEDGKRVINVVWDDLYNRPFYDIYVSFDGVSGLSNTFVYDGDTFFYHGTSPNHNYSFVLPDEATNLRIIIQPASNKKLIKGTFIIYDSNVVAS